MSITFLEVSFLLQAALTFPSFALLLLGMLISIPAGVSDLG